MRYKSPRDIEQALQKYGPSLNAVWDNENLSYKEKHLLNYLTRGMNMSHLITDFRQVLCKARIQKATGFSEPTVRRTITNLVNRGYLSKIKCTTATGKQLSNVYVITSKLFDEYREFITQSNSKFEAGDAK